MKAINLILNESHPPNVYFLEIEDDNGRSVNIGERIQKGNFIRLRITTADIDLAVPELPPPSGQ